MNALSIIKDFNGQPIYDGDTVELSHGRRGIVQHNIVIENPDLRWAINLGHGSLIPLNRQSVASEIVLVHHSHVN